jgi:hypothetical protein
LAVRVYMNFNYDVNLLRPQESICKYYPRLRETMQSTIPPNNGSFDILILGGSSVNRKISYIEDILFNELALRGNKKIRIYNVSDYAHSSLDSYIKYKNLKDKKFDLVIVYNGINEVRANNCPKEFFKANYAHCKFYEKINVFDSHPEVRWFMLPWICHDLFINIKHKYVNKHYIPYEQPYSSLLEYGDEIKTTDSFRNNFENILSIARGKGEPVLIMTFSFYVPSNYSRDAFESGTLDYEKNSQAVPIEMWGRPDNVVKGIQAHNTVIRELAKNNDVLFVDQEKVIPKSGKYFIDICHLSLRGQKKFVENILNSFKLVDNNPP